MIRLYLDEHIHGGIARELRRRGIDVLTAQEDGRTGAADRALLDRAGSLGRALVTQDDDLLTEGTSRQAAGVPFNGIVFLRSAGLPLGMLIDELEIVAVAGEFEEIVGQIQFVPIR